MFNRIATPLHHKSRMVWPSLKLLMVRKKKVNWLFIESIVPIHCFMRFCTLFVIGILCMMFMFTFVRDYRMTWRVPYSLTNVTCFTKPSPIQYVLLCSIAHKLACSFFFVKVYRYMIMFLDIQLNDWHMDGKSECWFLYFSF